jgi:1,2-dihydroxy-3-keto-5-methylthiopentene dioxygenase
MSALTIHSAQQPREGVGETIYEFEEISRHLNAIDVLFERWQAEHEFSADAEPEIILNAYRDSIDKLQQQFGFKSVDVISMTADNPQKSELRRKFLSEHTHNDFEVRFFVYGCGLFYLHVADKVYVVLCNQGDLISVPAGVAHWFDMGENPNFKCVRLFSNDQGWIAEFTGSEISEKFPGLDEYLQNYVQSNHY